MASLSSLVSHLMVRPGAYPCVERLKVSEFGQALALLANIRQTLPVKSNLAYYEQSLIMPVRSFITSGAGVVFTTLVILRKS
jgi:hypothetical protein